MPFCHERLRREGYLLGLSRHVIDLVNNCSNSSRTCLIETLQRDRITSSVASTRIFWAEREHRIILGVQKTLQRYANRAANSPTCPYSLANSGITPREFQTAWKVPEPFLGTTQPDDRDGWELEILRTCRQSLQSSITPDEVVPTIGGLKDNKALGEHLALNENLINAAAFHLLWTLLYSGCP